MPQGSQSIGIKATKIYEVEPSHRRFKIKIKKLCKRYAPNSRGALNSFTWNVYENEVTVLMGHNGCGKSTLLKILAGLLEPTRGLVMVADYNIQTERQDASMQLGLALNNNLLVPDFSVADQIRFICLVKGASWTTATEEIELYTQRLQLTQVKQNKVKTLTAQQRNLLSIGCAFAGGSSIVLIDDLHCDLDLLAQSVICGLINEEKSRRTIILVSNSTALANHVADRLAIMSNGELKCTGTKPFLRNMYGHGFRLVSSSSSQSIFDSQNCICNLRSTIFSLCLTRIDSSFLLIFDPSSSIHVFRSTIFYFLTIINPKSHINMIMIAFLSSALRLHIYIQAYMER